MTLLRASLASLALVACAAPTASGEDPTAATSEGELVTDLECSPHPWSSSGGCGASGRSSFEGPRTAPHVLYDTRAVGPVLAAKDGSIFFRRELSRRSSHPGWVPNIVQYGEARFTAASVTPVDYPNRGASCELTPDGRYYTCGADQIAEALDPAGNVARLSYGSDGNWQLDVLAAADKASLGTTPTGVKAEPKLYPPKLHALKGGTFAVAAGAKLVVVKPGTGPISTCEGCDLRGVYGADILVARANATTKIWDATAWWTPATGALSVVPSPPKRYPADGWVPLGALADGGIALYLDPQTVESVSDQLAIVGHDGTVRAKVAANAAHTARITPLSNGDLLFVGTTRVGSTGTVLWSTTPGAPLSTYGVPAVVDGKDVTYALASEPVAGGSSRRVLRATSPQGATLWTVDRDLPEGPCSLGIAGGRRLFLSCNRRLTILAE